MSTKIYDGLRAVGRTDVFALSTEIRRVLNAEFFSMLDDVLDQDPNEFLSLQEAMAVESPIDLSSVRAPYEITARIDELNRSREHTFHPLDLGFTVQLFRGLDWPLLIVFGEKAHGYTQALLRSGVVEDYGYWDNSDQPDEVNDRDWDHRRKDWAQALTDTPTGVPADNGLAINHPSSVSTTLHIIEHRRTHR